MGALAFGHLPVIFVPGGPMPTGLPNYEKSRIRQLYAEGKVGRTELLAAEAGSYHAPGTCTFYGTANSNQMMMEAMGLHLPGAAFVNPNTPLRTALTRAATHRAAQITAQGNDYRPLAEIIDERAIVNAVATLVATGGSTNHTIHLVAMASIAGIRIDWDDIADISRATPLLARVYPNGKADVNQFQAAGGTGFVIAQLLATGRMHGDVETVVGKGLSAYAREPWLNDGKLDWRDGPAESGDRDILRPANDPFDSEGGIRLLTGNLGRSIIKVSAVKPQHRVVRAPAAIFDDQNHVLTAFKNGELHRDVVVVVRGQGPRANGMPELHKLTPALGVLQDLGYKVALVTDGRMSGASGKVPAAIHVSPEAAGEGPIGRLHDGDVVALDSERQTLTAEVPDLEWKARPQWHPDPQKSAFGFGRELFGAMRSNATLPEQGAITLLGAA
ncbi:MAG TPA: phosphogluconate dehydratase, partial [Dongiaceae bacterium]